MMGKIKQQFLVKKHLHTRLFCFDWLNILTHVNKNLEQ